MDWNEILDWFTWENLLLAISHYRSLGTATRSSFTDYRSIFNFLTFNGYHYGECQCIWLGERIYHIVARYKHRVVARIYDYS